MEEYVSSKRASDLEGRGLKWHWTCSQKEKIANERQLCGGKHLLKSAVTHGRPASSSAAFPHRGCAPQKQNTRHIAGKLWWKWNHMKQVMKKLSMMTSCRTQLLLAGHWHDFELDILLSGPHLRLLILPPSLNTVSRSNLRTWSLNLHSYKLAHCVSVELDPWLNLVSIFLPAASCKPARL